MTWDEERIRAILQSKYFRMHQRKEFSVTEIQQLVTDVRAEAIDWTWTVARQQYAQGRDPNRQPMPELLERALTDLNPERDK